MDADISYNRAEKRDLLSDLGYLSLFRRLAPQSQPQFPSDGERFHSPETLGSVLSVI